MASLTDNRQWHDIIVEEEERAATRLLRISAAEWKEEGTRILRAWRGRDIRPVLAYLDRVDRQRAAYAAQVARPVAPVVVRRPRTEFDVDFAIWKDMIEEPAKYGDDICEWLALNEKLTHGSGRWRLGAYWAELQAEEDAKAEALVAPWRALYSQVAKEAAVAGERAWVSRDIKRHVARFRKAIVTIQAAVRGHLARNAQPFRDCCMCLSHRTCPLKTDVGMMCRACGEQGPYEDITGPVSDGWNWFRAEFVDLAPGAEDFDPVSVIPYPKCHYCTLPLLEGPTCRWCTLEVPTCRECRCPLEDGQIRFCDRDCEYAYMKEEWRGRN
jgi:hypothetical protein